MGVLTADRQAVVDRACVVAESSLRAKFAGLVRASLPDLTATVVETLSIVLDAFRVESREVVQERKASAAQARADAVRLLERFAGEIHEWLVPVVQASYRWPFSFKRYSSNDRFLFTQHVMESLQVSQAWLSFLGELADEAAPPSRPTPPSEKKAGFSWSDLAISLVSEERGEIILRGDRSNRNYAEMGFEDRRTGAPSKAWSMLLLMAKDGEVLVREHPGHRHTVEKRIQEIRVRIRRVVEDGGFLLPTENPIPLSRGRYRPCFVLRTRRSFES